jgi:hypothetical protein
MEQVKKRLLISFSGGRTSAYMMWWLMTQWKDRHEYEIVIVFANTGKEDEATLQFVQECAVRWGLEIIWVEAKHRDENGNPYSEKGWAVKHRIVSYLTASRNGEPFEEMISVLGIPCSEAPFCSDQLKRKVIESYLSSIGWKDYYKAIGIRVDEIDRMNENFRKLKIIYPLITLHPTTENMLLDWWRKNDFNLTVDFDLGNCDGCWKKSMRRLTSIAKRHPYVFNWWQLMIDRYSGSTTREGIAKASVHSFYRGGKTIADIFALAKLEQTQLELFIEEERLDGCSESCEAFNNTMEDAA